ncbi:hypothetical protein [Ornithinibacillus californiensis]|uniref:hypothetical protein n=1 Tax=Ornithinibacillus californiensis TaxID=161536 RepID=UPI00064D9F66|nr:hypothetical protein [Ornithinibacillus californiensis]
MLWLIIFVIIVSVIGLVATLIVLKQEGAKMKKYEEEGDTAENELQRSLEYETKSLSSNVKNLTWIYVVVLLLSFIAFAVYMFMR